jgi:hypothetical protein
MRVLGVSPRSEFAVTYGDGICDHQCRGTLTAQAAGFLQSMRDADRRGARKRHPLDRIKGAQFG